MHKLGDTFYLLFPTHDAHGALSDADATPVVEVFEDASDSAMAYLPPVAKVGVYTGLYRATVVASAANGFEAGKSYNFVAAIRMDSVDLKSRIDLITSLQTNDIDDVDTVVDAIKLQADKMEFSGTDIKATLDSEKVVVSSIDAGVITASVLAADALQAVQDEAYDALEDANLDHVMKVAAVIGDVADDSVIARMTSKSTPASFNSFINATDALEAIRDAITSGTITVADIWAYIVTGLEPAGSTAELLATEAAGSSITAESIVRALLTARQSDYMAVGTIGRSLFEASHGRVTPVMKDPIGDHVIDIDLSGVLKDKGTLDRTASVVMALDKTGRDTTSSLIAGTVYLGQKVRLTLRGGEVAKAPYSVRIVVRTTQGFSYQHEIQVYVMGG